MRKKSFFGFPVYNAYRYAYNKNMKNKAAQKLGSLGGKARRDSMTEKERSESARSAAKARWNKSKKKKRGGVA